MLCCEDRKLLELLDKMMFSHLNWFHVIWLSANQELQPGLLYNCDLGRSTSAKQIEDLVSL